MSEMNQHQDDLLDYQIIFPELVLFNMLLLIDSLSHIDKFLDSDQTRISSKLRGIIYTIIMLAPEFSMVKYFYYIYIRIFTKQPIIIFRYVNIYKRETGQTGAKNKGMGFRTQGAGKKHLNFLNKTTTLIILLFPPILKES